MAQFSLYVYNIEVQHFQRQNVCEYNSIDSLSGLATSHYINNKW